MRKYIQNALLVFASVAAVALLVVAVLPSGVEAQTKTAICEGIGIAGGSSNCQPQQGQPTVDQTIKNVINIFSFVVGVISVIMIIIGGLKYVTSAGDSSKVSSAKDTILYAIIGLVVVAMAQVIVQFVVGRI
jgi:cytochrome bd-type quinol oxidase subunit 2